MINEISTLAEFNNIIFSNSTVICKFYATWCGPCKSYAETFSDISENYDDVPFISVDVDKLPELTNKYTVRSVPTTIKFYNGEVSLSKPGSMSKNDLVQLVNGE